MGVPRSMYIVSRLILSGPSLSLLFHVPPPAPRARPFVDGPAAFRKGGQRARERGDICARLYENRAMVPLEGQMSF